jgi:hypothetical protein
MNKIIVHILKSLHNYTAKYNFKFSGTSTHLSIQNLELTKSVDTFALKRSLNHLHQ